MYYMIYRFWIGETGWKWCQAQDILWNTPILCSGSILQTEPTEPTEYRLGFGFRFRLSKCDKW